MLMLRYALRALGVCFVATGLAVGLAILLNSPFFASCNPSAKSIQPSEQQSNANSANKDCTSLGRSLYVSSGDGLAWLNQLTLAHDREITAGSTAIIALFTVILGVATSLQYCAVMASIRENRRAADQQALLTREQLKLAREEFISTHRPQIIVRNVHIVRDTASQALAGSHLGVEFEMANIGGTRATIVASSMSLDFLDGGWLRTLQFPKIGEHAMRTWKDFVLEPGTFIVQWYGSPEAIFQDHHFLIYPQGSGLFFNGHILYQDEINQIRRTSFCRRFDHTRGYWPPAIYYDQDHAD
jgi:hypothetical protein